MRDGLQGVRDDPPRAPRGGLARGVGELMAGGLAGHVGRRCNRGSWGAPSGGGPVDARTTNWVGSWTAAGPAASSSRRTASEPLRSWGWRMVVSGGAEVAAAGTSSNRRRRVVMVLRSRATRGGVEHAEGDLCERVRMAVGRSARSSSGARPRRRGRGCRPGRSRRAPGPSPRPRPPALAPAGEPCASTLRVAAACASAAVRRLAYASTSRSSDDQAQSGARRARGRRRGRRC